MRVCRLEDGRLGTVEADAVVPRAGGDPLAVLAGDVPAPSGGPIPLSAARLAAPLRPGKLIGIGLNYRAHAAETGAPLPSEPLLFVKLNSAITGPSGPVVRPASTDELDYEGELAAVIGRRARRVPVGEALDHVVGYAVMDDVSARDLQRAEPRWVRAKGLDSFAPFGPWITPPDLVPDPQALRIRTWVNGELRQDGTTADMVFSVAELVAYCSENFTLEPGDVIATGTPAGVGVARTPPSFLRPGDVVRVEIDGLGAIEHPVVAE